MVTTRLMSRFGGLLLAALLCACGGGAGIGGGTSNPDPDPDPDPGVTVSRLILLASTTQLPSSADLTSEGVSITALAIGTSGSVITDVPITFAIPPSSGVLGAVNVQADGSYRTTLTTGGDPTNREIVVLATAQTVSASVTISVVGTTLTIVGPETVGFGQVAEYVITLLDAAGAGLGGRTINVTSSAGALSSSSLTTAAGTGEARVILTGANNGTLAASSLGLSASAAISVSADQFKIISPAANAEIPLGTSQGITVEWLRSGSAAETAGRTVIFSSTRGVFTPASAVLDGNGRATVNLSASNAGGAVVVASSSALSQPSVTLPIEFVARQAHSVSLQASPAVVPTNGQSLVSAVVRDINGNLVKGRVVDFTLTDTTGGSLSAPSAVTNSQGTASITYRSTSVISADGGVRVDAVVRDSVVTSSQTLTVGGRALRITLGTGNEIFEPNETTYEYPYSVIVTDSAGNPVPSADFQLSVLPVAYRKGAYIVPIDAVSGAPGDRWVLPSGLVRCLNEDVDRDGVLDVGPGAGVTEDFNGNGRLDPGNVATVPTSLTLNANGAAQFVITYPQDRANWVDVELRARASVAGTETTESIIFTLPVLSDDLDDVDITPPGQISPYGVVQSCNVAD